MYRYLVMAVVAAPLLGGCVAWEEEAARMRADNIARMESYTDEAVINGVLTERTVYPYYFYHDTPRLTELGRRNLSILGAYYKNYPGPLNIRQRGTPDGLYEARVAEVREHLARWGVAIEEIEVRDEFPGGDGMPSSRLYEMVEADEGLTASSGMDVQ